MAQSAEAKKARNTKVVFILLFWFSVSDKVVYIPQRCQNTVAKTTAIKRILVVVVLLRFVFLVSTIHTVLTFNSCLFLGITFLYFDIIYFESKNLNFAKKNSWKKSSCLFYLTFAVLPVLNNSFVFLRSTCFYMTRVLK